METKNTPVENKSKQMTLSQCAAYDKQSNARGRLTGWGLVCKRREASGNSRAARIRRGLTKRGRAK